MFDQASKLREWIQAAPPGATVSVAGAPMVAVFGGRAGLGTTTIAVNLAAVLADAQQRVLLVDAAGADNELTAVAGVVDAGKTDSPYFDLLAGRCTARDAVVAGPAGTQLMAATPRTSSRRARESRRYSAMRAAADSSRRAHEHFLAELQAIRSDFDLLVVDLGSGLSPCMRRLWLQARLVLVVTTTESGPLLDAYTTIKRNMEDGLSPEVRLVVNQYDDEQNAAEAGRRLSESCARFLHRAVPSLPPVPRYVADRATQPWPRVWETPHSPFGHALLWLGHAVSDLISNGQHGSELDGTAGGVSDAAEMARSTARN